MGLNPECGPVNGPTLVGSTEPFAGMIRAVAGDFAYVAEAWDLDGRLHVLDISDLANPSVLAS